MMVKELGAEPGDRGDFSACRGSQEEVVQELGRRDRTRDQQTIAGAGAGHVQQVPLGGVHLIKVRVVGNRYEPLHERLDLVVTSHDGDGAEPQTEGQPHHADRVVRLEHKCSSSREYYTNTGRVFTWWLHTVRTKGAGHGERSNPLRASEVFQFARWVGMPLHFRRMNLASCRDSG